jgi:hypothetical protein
MPSKDAGAQKRGTKRKLAAELRSSPAQEAGVETDVSSLLFMRWLAARSHLLPVSEQAVTEWAAHA